jgi:predicted metal-dependent hydrolase
MTTILQLGALSIEVVQKNIKNIHLSVYPPHGTVKVAAPLHYDIELIRVYVNSKSGWIKKQQAKILAQVRETPRDFVTRESHYFKGKRYLLQITEQDASPKVVLHHSKIELLVRPNMDIAKRETILQEWYRTELKKLIPPLIAKWEQKMGVSVNDWQVKQMKTKWGTCNTEKKRILFNLELAKKPVECLEFVIVHELVHLLERLHNDRFFAYMDKFLPNWQHLRNELNALPTAYPEVK